MNYILDIIALAIVIVSIIFINAIIGGLLTSILKITRGILLEL